jgi:hypothetical protein
VNRWSGFLQVTIGLIALVVCVVIGVWGITSGERSAARAGSFDKPDIALYVGSVRIFPGTPTALIIAAPFEAKTVTLFHLPLRVVNFGTKTAHDVSVLVRFPEALRRGLNETETLSTSQFDPSMQMSHSQGTIGHFEFKSHSFSAVNPRSAGGIDELFAIDKPTSFVMPVDLPKEKIHVAVEYSYTVQITVSQVDADPQEYTIEFVAYEIHDNTQLESDIAHYVEVQLRNRRRSLSRFQYALHLFRNPMGDLLVAPTVTESATHVGDDAVVRASSFANTISRLRYKQTAIGLLFKTP